MTSETAPPTATPRWPGLLVWSAGAAAMLALDGQVDLANLALLLVLTATLATLWLPGPLAAGAGVLAVLAFNWRFVPPRHSLAVDLRQHALLLGGMLLVQLVVVGLMERLRRRAQQAAAAGAREALLRSWSDTLRDADEPVAHAAELLRHLATLTGVPTALVVEDPHATASPAPVMHVGEADADQAVGLAHCQRSGQAMGAGSGRHEEQPDVYLPLRGRGRTPGAVVLRGLGRHADRPELRAQAQALCDLFGQALQRAHEADQARHTHEQAQLQAVRNALLAAISHDHRTPLATILGAASSLQQQDERLSREQRLRLVSRIVDEAEHLRRLTDNTLQLARLDAPGLQLQADWESAEDLVGAALQRARAHDPQRRVRARLEPGLPLLWCDAMLLSQLLDNLIDNALKYSPADAPVELLVRSQPDAVVLAVRDRGAGVAPAWRQRVFEPFHRGAEPMAGAPTSPGLAERPGAGVGLAVCRAIARAHGGELKLRPRGHGGSSFELWLPLRPQPQPLQEVS